MSRPAGLAALLLLTAELSAAAAAELRGPTAGDVVHAGERAVVSWAVPLAGTEAELLLSLDGGASFPLRLTPESAPDARALAFRVPNLPSRHAVLALRTGEEETEETIRLVGEEFEIAGDPSAPPEPVVRHAGELATREAAPRADAPLPTGLGSSAPSVSALADPPDAADAPGILAAVPDDAPRRAVARPLPSPLPRAGRFRARISLPKRE